MPIPKKWRTFFQNFYMELEPEFRYKPRLVYFLLACSGIHFYPCNSNFCMHFESSDMAKQQNIVLLDPGDVGSMLTDHKFKNRYAITKRDRSVFSDDLFTCRKKLRLDIWDLVTCVSVS